MSKANELCLNYKDISYLICSKYFPQESISSSGDYLDCRYCFDSCPIQGVRRSDRRSRPIICTKWNSIITRSSYNQSYSARQSSYFGRRRSRSLRCRPDKITLYTSDEESLVPGAQIFILGSAGSCTIVVHGAGSRAAKATFIHLRMRRTSPEPYRNICRNCSLLRPRTSLTQKSSHPCHSGCFVSRCSCNIRPESSPGPTRRQLPVGGSPDLAKKQVAFT